MEQVEWYWQWKRRKKRRKKKSQSQFIHHKSHISCLESNMGLWGGKLTTNHLSQGMVTNFNTNFCTNLDFTNILKVKVWQKDKIITEVMAVLGLLNESDTMKQRSNQFISSYIKLLYRHTSKKVRAGPKWM